MKIIETDKPLTLKSETEKLYAYNGYDCMLTAEILDVLLPQLDPHTSATYDFSRALQGPALEMRLRGVRIDPRRKAEVIDLYFDKLDILETQLERIVREGCGFVGFNWRSNTHLKELFYDRLGIPVIRRQGRPTVNRDALERMESYIVAKPIVRHIEAMRDLGKKISVLKTEIDTDGRIRTSYNIGGTTTGRFSSSFSEFGTGTNLQNIEEVLRSVFIADPGMKMGYFDAKSGESYAVGAIEWNLFRDGRYLDACETGDPHTFVARLCWPGDPWTGNLAIDQGLAERPYYRHYTKRFMCKKIGHGSNYAGKPRTISYETKIEIGLIEEFQPKYFLAFPAHHKWHAAVEQTLNQLGYLITLTGRKRWFFGRRGDSETLRSAIAYDPQGSLADILNAGMLQVWRERRCELLMQIHDAILVQYPEEQEDEIVPLIQEQLRYPIELKHGRQLIIPYGAKTGWNWGDWSEGNIDGLKAYSSGDKRKRSSQVHILDRKFR